MPTLPTDELRATLVRTQARWEPGDNPILRLTDDERRGLLGDLSDEVRRRAEVNEANAFVAEPAPSGIARTTPVFDWRDQLGQNHVTPAKNQDPCASCVSFCVTSVVESMVSIEHAVMLDLSEADLHFCSSHGSSCHGWHSSDAIDQVKERGITLETDFPYDSAFVGGVHCHLAPHRQVHAVRVEHRQPLWMPADRKWWISNVGPVAASMEVFSDFYHYKSGVYEHRMGGSEGTHCVAVIGYSDTEKYWICKNSWGTKWGEQGFFKIGYGQCRIDPGPVFRGFFGFSTAFPMQGVRGTVLLPEFPIRGQLSKATTAVAAHEETFHMVHLDNLSNALWHSQTTDGDVWSHNVEIPGQLSRTAVALAVFGGALHMVHGGDDSNSLWHSVWDGQTWSHNVEIPGQLSRTAVALAVFGGALHMVHGGDDSNSLWHSVWDGQTWSHNVQIPGQLSRSGAALAPFGGTLHMVHAGDGSNDIWHSVYNGFSWTANVRLPLKRSKVCPSLAGFESHLQMVHLGNTTNQIWQGWVVSTPRLAPHPPVQSQGSG